MGQAGVPVHEASGWSLTDRGSTGAAHDIAHMQQDAATKLAALPDVKKGI